MPRPPRIDAEGTWWHVFNRGIARRTMFETSADIRYFLSLLAWCVRAGLIEVHAYAILPTHFHLLVRSRSGRLSEAMQWIQDLYSRRFNRTRRRDGPLVRGRFGARRVDTPLHFEALVRYIDLNPVEARIAETATTYPWGSAAAYAGGRRPPWLETSVIDSLLAEFGRGPGDDPLRALHGAAPFASAREIVERRSGTPAGSDSLDDLVGAAPDRVRRWMDRKARLADGSAAGAPVLTAAAVLQAVRNLPSGKGESPPRLPRARGPARSIVEAGLLRWGAGLGLEEIGRLTEISTTAARARVNAHARAVVEDPDYGVLAADVFVAAASIDHGILPRRWRLPSMSRGAADEPSALDPETMPAAAR